MYKCSQVYWSKCTSYFSCLHAERSRPFSAELSRLLEKAINMVLCAVQTIVKRKEKENPEDQQSESKIGGSSPRILHVRGDLCVCSFYMCFSREWLRGGRGALETGTLGQVTGRRPECRCVQSLITSGQWSRDRASGETSIPQGRLPAPPTTGQSLTYINGIIC